MRKAAIILARLDSKRFPQKAIYKIMDKTLIEWCISSLTPNNGFDIVIATSNRSVDNPLEEIAKKNNIKCFRGDANNVSKRVLDCITFYEIDLFARVNGDSPLIISDQLVNGFKVLEDFEYDFVTNLVPREFPYGISIEIFRTEKYKEVFNLFKSENHFEHVSSYFYENIDNFKPYFIKYTGDNDHGVRLVVDVPEDVKIIEEILKFQLEKGKLSIQEIVTKYKSIKKQQR